jgi:hypothetical protein
MRHEIARGLSNIVTKPSTGEFEGEATSAKEHIPGVPADAAAIAALDSATESLGANSQQGLLSRNACHFAPYSWERWSLHHKEARDEATKHFAEAQGAMGSGGGMRTHERNAWVNNGYGNHFLQDSFAAGHLINKTLVMQWFVEWLDKHGDAGRLNDRRIAKDLTERAQPGLAHRSLYKGPRFDTTASQDRATGTSPVDPQTNYERRTGAGRLGGSGVEPGKHGRAYAFHEYGELLNDAYANISANNTHDFFNHMGLIVANGRGDRFKVGGDGSFLFLSGDAGIRLPIEANQRSDAAITQLLTTGTTAISMEEIFGYFPVSVEWQGKMLPLDQWNGPELRKICEDIVFPKIENWKMKLLRAQFPRLVENAQGTALP